MISPPPHPSWWTARRRVAAVAVALVVVVAGALVVAPQPDVPTEQLLAGERPEEPTARGADVVVPEYPPADIPVIGDPDAWDPDAAERTADPGCGRCEDREPPRPTAPAAEPGPAPTRPETETETDVSSGTAEEEDPAPPPVDAGLLALVNRDRAAEGCGPVTPHPDLMAQSQAQSDRQATDDDTYHSDGVTGFGTWGENVAGGYDTAAAVHQAWMDSAGHRRNILECQFTAMGVGVADGPSGRYWTQQFGG